jgi:hypothetical protein
MRVIELSDSEVRMVVGMVEGVKSGTVHSLKFAVAGDQIQVKVNHGMWTHNLGHLDPQCEAAYAERQAGRVAGEQALAAYKVAALLY